MNELTKITIVTISYNSEKTIERTIQSVISQKYDNTEYWIIDGKSTDSTMKIVKEYAEKYDFIKYISEKDNGISDAFNKGIKKSTGELIGLINSDDCLAEGALQTVKNLEEDPDILIVKKYMLESYKKVDNYFEKAVRGRHAVDSAAEIRNRTEIKYLDTTMRELVAEVSEAHCADERNIYGAKSNATSQLISIKYDKILLRLADLLDMSSYRVSKPILHHNIEQMSEESAFHWISHLLTQKYELHSKYEISDPEDEKSILAPQTITENIVLEIPVDLSQMSALECNNPCQKIKIDRKNILPQEITLTCGEKCEDDSEGDVNSERRCNFLCQWFCVKNDYLIKELAALKEYLNRNTNNYFKSKIQIKIKCNGKTNIDARQFEILTDYIQNKKR